MTAEPDPVDVFESVLQSAHTVLAPLSYVRRGHAFRKITSDSCGMVHFQKSRDSTKHRILFTINIGVTYEAVRDSEDPPLASSQIIDAHLSQRIGFLMSSRSDHWWEIVATTDASELGREISALLNGIVAPYLGQYLDPHHIYELWKSGQSPGLTDVQRRRYLERLDRFLASRGP